MRYGLVNRRFLFVVRDVARAFGGLGNPVFQLPSQVLASLTGGAGCVENAMMLTSSSGSRTRPRTRSTARRASEGSSFAL